MPSRSRCSSPSLRTGERVGPSWRTGSSAFERGIEPANEMSELAEWDSFYVIVGSAAGALIGLQFVVMTLIAERPPVRASEAGAAFATPTIVHFGVVLLLSALLRAPWHAIAPAASLWGLVGLCGVIYTAIVARRMRVQ